MGETYFITNESNKVIKFHFSKTFLHDLCTTISELIIISQYESKVFNIFSLVSDDLCC